MRRDLWLHTSTMTCHAIHFVIAIRKNTSTARKASIDQSHHRDHLARDFFLWRVDREIALHMTICALHSQRLFEDLHNERNFTVWCEEFQVFRRGRGSPSAATLLLSKQRHWQRKQEDEFSHARIL